MIAGNNIMLDELKNKIGFEGSLEELKQEVFESENDEAIQTTLERLAHSKAHQTFQYMISSIQRKVSV